MKWYRSGVAVLAIAAVAGCAAQDGEEQGAADAASETAAPAPTTAPEVDDADIASIVVTANTIDVQNGELALERASDDRVKQFAQTMITDHTAVNESAGQLVSRLGVTPTPNDVSRSLEQSANQTRDSLRALSGPEFDRAYVRNEVEYHRAVLSALDDTLIPNATNAELRETLVGVRPAFQAHLEHAESLLAQLNGSGS